MKALSVGFPGLEKPNFTLFPCYLQSTCIFSNGLSTMGFAVPGAIAAKLACPERKIIAVTGDGSFMMNSGAEDQRFAKTRVF